MSVYPQIANNEQLLHLDRVAVMTGYKIHTAQQMRVGRAIRYTIEILRGGVCVKSYSTDRIGLRGMIAEASKFMTDNPCLVK